jgi:hypothetical protein
MRGAKHALDSGQRTRYHVTDSPPFLQATRPYESRKQPVLLEIVNKFLSPLSVDSSDSFRSHHMLQTSPQRILLHISPWVSALGSLDYIFTIREPSINSSLRVSSIGYSPPSTELSCLNTFAEISPDIDYALILYHALRGRDFVRSAGLVTIKGPSRCRRKRCYVYCETDQ